MQVTVLERVFNGMIIVYHEIWQNDNHETEISFERNISKEHQWSTGFQTKIIGIRVRTVATDICRDTMDIKSMPASEQRPDCDRQAINLLEKLIKHNSEYGADTNHTANAAELQLEKSLRDVKNFNRIMEKLKFDNGVDNIIQDNYKDG